jgi:hypothetical protein
MNICLAMHQEMHGKVERLVSCLLFVAFITAASIYSEKRAKKTPLLHSADKRGGEN